MCVGVTHTVCHTHTSYCNPRNVRHIFLPSLSHATITKHTRHDRKTWHLGLCMLQFATFTTPNCMCCYCGVHRIALCIYLRVFANPVHAHTCCALRTLLKRPNARKRVCTRSRTFERMRSHANAKTWGCACRNLRHAQPQVFAHVGARSTQCELGEHWRAFNARVGTRWRFT